MAAVWLCAPILAIVHGQETVHSYCAEHGTFEESAPGQPQAARGTPAAIDVAADAGPAHERCAFSPFARGAATTDEPPALAVRAPALPALALPALASPAPPLDILAVAPKSSPPSVA